MNIKAILGVMIGVGILILGLCVYLLFKQNAEIPSSNNIQADKTETFNKEIATRPNCVISYPAGSCWTIPNHPVQKPLRLSSDSDFNAPKVTVTDNTCTIIVPASDADGVEAKGCEVRKGQAFEILAEGTTLFSMEHPRSDANGMKGWYDPYVDSPFSQNVGGLEFSIGSLNANRYFAGTHYKAVAKESGELIFRVIDRSERDSQNKAGGFKVYVTK